MKKNYFLLLILVCVSINIWAQQTINLNNEKANNQLSLKKAATLVGISPEYLKEAKAARIFSINPALQRTESVKIGDVVNLQLFETETYTATIINKITDVNGTLALTLKLPDYPMAFAIITTSKDGKSLVTVSIPELGRNFGSRYSANAYYLIEIDESKQEVFESENDAVISEELGTTENGPQLRAVNCEPLAYSNQDAPATIDVLIVYTPAVANSSYVSGYGGINLVISDMIAKGNLCLSNSQTGITLALAHSTEVAYSETGDMKTSLTHLAGTSDGFMDNVHTLRKQYNADLVQLISTDNGAGVGYLLKNTNGNIGDAFSVVNITTAVGNLSSIHELGHNMGLGHGANHINKDIGIFPYSLGWDWTATTNGARYCSVMSYPGDIYYSDGIQRSRVPYFSNPSVTHEGQPTGNAVQADAARSLREMKHVIANYSDRLDNLLNAPTNIVVSNPTNNGATFSWDAVANATGYRIGFPELGKYWSTTQTTFRFNNPDYWSPCNTYQFYVSAVNECGDAASSPTLTFTTTGCPDTRTWNGTTSDWTVAANWTPAQIPTANDDVVIPKSASSNYPVVPAGGATIKNITIQAGAEIGNQHLLNYEKAFVQYDFSGDDSRNRWHMLSVPLQEAYPGDFTFGGYPLTWVRNFVAKPNGSSGYTAGWETTIKSTTPFNAGNGFIVWLGENDGTDNKGLQLSNGILELPFFDNASVQANVHHTHDYAAEISTFYNFKEVTGGGYERNMNQSYTVFRTDAAYKLAGSSITESLSFGRDNNYESDFALVGNPFMASLDFNALQTANTTKIKPNYQVWTGKGEDAGYTGYTSEGGFGISGITVTTDKYIAPMQSFIVEKASGYTSGDLEFNISMTETGKGSLRSAVNNADKLSIVAKNEVAEVLTFIAKREGGQDIFGDRDARKLMNGISNVPEIYTLKPAGNQLTAVGANIINNDNLLIPVGLATAYSGKITLTFTGMDSYQAKITLIDTETKVEKDLTGLASYEYSFDYTGQSVPNEDRFFIRLQALGAPTGFSVASEPITVYNREGFIHVVSGASNLIKQVSVYNLQGALIQAENTINSVYYTSNRGLVSGIYIVKVISEKGVKNVKLVIK